MRFDPEWPGRQRRRLAEAFAQGRFVHLTHGECLDGHSCAGLLQRARPDAFWLGLRPPETSRALEWAAEAAEAMPEGMEGRVLVTDLSLAQDDVPAGTEALRRLARRARVAWLDHHAPQWPQDVEQAVAASGVRVRVDRTGTECGATMLLSLLAARGDDARWLGLEAPDGTFTEADAVHMRSVGNRDTWTDPDDRRGILLGLASARLRRDYVTLVRHGEYRAMLLLAEGPFRERQRQVLDAMGRIRRDGPVSVVFGRTPLSDLADAHWKADPGARLLVHFTDDGLLRIRSRRDTPVAATLAGRFGGGGHANAAGAPLLEGRPLRLRVYRILGRRDPAVRKVLRPARRLLA
jgi:hypothetical protein